MAAACALLGLAVLADGQKNAFGDPAQPVVWRGLTDANWYSGPKISAEDLAGKVVLVDEWGVNCPPCRALLPRMEQVWSSFSSKPFFLLGSHRQGRLTDQVAALVKANGLTYPIYEGAGLEAEPDNGGGLPFLFVVDSAGVVVYAGRDEREAEAAVVNALTDALPSDSLLGSVSLKKFKPLAKTLVFGQNAESKLSALREVARHPETPNGKEAAAIVQAVSNAQQRIEARIRKEIETRPGAALTDIQKYVRTWPSRQSEFSADASKLSSNSEVAKLQQLDQAIAKLEQKPVRNAGQAKTVLAQAESLKKSNTALGESKDEAVAKEGQMLLSRLDSLITDLTRQATPAKKR